MAEKFLLTIDLQRFCECFVFARVSIAENLFWRGWLLLLWFSQSKFSQISMLHNQNKTEMIWNDDPLSFYQITYFVIYLQIKAVKRSCDIFEVDSTTNDSIHKRQSVLFFWKLLLHKIYFLFLKNSSKI